MDKLVVFVPVADAERLIDALAAAGAGAIGDYERCAWTSEGTGTFRPLAGAHPAIGAVGEIETVPETRVEMVVPAAARGGRDRRAAGRAPVRGAGVRPARSGAAADAARHAGGSASCRAPMTLREFTRTRRGSAAGDRWGVRAAGDPERRVRTVAVCGGSRRLADRARPPGRGRRVT